MPILQETFLQSLTLAKHYQDALRKVHKQLLATEGLAPEDIAFEHKLLANDIASMLDPEGMEFLAKHLSYIRENAGRTQRRRIRQRIARKGQEWNPSDYGLGADDIFEAAPSAKATPIPQESIGTPQGVALVMTGVDANGFPTFSPTPIPQEPNGTSPTLPCSPQESVHSTPAFGEPGYDPSSPSAPPPFDFSAFARKQSTPQVVGIGPQGKLEG